MRQGQRPPGRRCWSTAPTLFLRPLGYSGSLFLAGGTIVTRTSRPRNGNPVAGVRFRSGMTPTSSFLCRVICGAPGRIRTDTVWYLKPVPPTCWATDARGGRHSPWRYCAARVRTPPEPLRGASGSISLPRTLNVMDRPVCPVTPRLHGGAVTGWLAGRSWRLRSSGPQ